MKAPKVQQQLGECITCKLCQHYLIDPVTILECVHSFCRSCLLKHLNGVKTCPVCQIELGPKLSNAFKRDLFLQSLVYKLVPDMYWNEMRRRTEYLRKRMITEEEIAFLLDNHMTDLANHLCAPFEKIPLCVEYVQSGPTQEEADEDVSLDWQQGQATSTVVSTPTVGSNEPGPSGISSGTKTGSSSSDAKKEDIDDSERSKMEVDSPNLSISSLEAKTDFKVVEDRKRPCKSEEPLGVISVPPQEFQRYFLLEAKTRLSAIRRVLEGKLKVRENGTQLLFLDTAKDSVLEDSCTLQDIAYIFGWDRRESLKILFTLQREPSDDEPPVLTMEEMPVLFAEERSGREEIESQEQAVPVIPPVTIPQLTVTLDAAAMEGSGKQQPIIVSGPTQPPRKRRKVSSPTKRTSRTPPAVQRMTGLSPHEKAPPVLAPQQPKESVPAKRNLLNPATLNGSVLASGAALPGTSAATQGPKADPKSSAGEKQENLNSRIVEILLHKGLPPPSAPVVTTTPSTSATTSTSSEPSRPTACIAAAPRLFAPGLTAVTSIRATPPSTSCIVPVPTSALEHLRSLQPRHEKINYEEYVRQFISLPRFYTPGTPGHPLICDPRIALAPIKSILSVPQTDVAPYLRPPPPNPYPSLIQQLGGLKKKVAAALVQDNQPME